MSAKDLWEAGVQLSTAPIEFAPPDLKKRYQSPQMPREVTLTPGLQMILERKQQSGENAAETKNWLSDIQRIFEFSHDKLAVIGVMHESLLMMLRTGELLAVGHEKNSKLKASPKIIPSRLLTRRSIKSRQDIVSADGYEFTSVRICLAPPTQRTNKRGRPTMQPKIDEAINSLRNDDYGFDRKLRKSQALLVQQRIQQLHPQARIPRDRTVARTISKDSRNN